MNQGLYSGVGAMRAAERRLEAITVNLSNVNTPGFKTQGATTTSFRLPGSNETQARTTLGTRHTPGDITTSSDPLHLALDGPGFFVVEGPTGELVTRRGDFSLDGNGVLVDSSGLPVAFEGSAGRIDPTGDPLTIDGSGLVRQGNADVGRLRIVDFERPEQLERINGWLFRPSPRAEERASGAAVHQGSLELSNASAVDQLVELVQVQRGFESAARMMGLIDQSYKSLIERR